MRRLTMLLACVAGIAAAADDALRELQDDDPAVRAAAATRLGRAGATEPEIEALIEAVFDEDSSVAKAAIDGLRRVGPAARAAAPYLEDVLLVRGDPDRAVARALLAIGGAGAEPALVRWLRERDALTAGAAALQDIAVAHVQGPLREALAERDALLVAEALYVLDVRRWKSEDITAVLAPLLDHPRACVRMFAALKLGGATAGAGILGPMLRDESPRRRRLAARFLSGPWAVPHFRAVVAHEDPALRAAAAACFGRVGAQADRTLVDDLIVLAGDADARVAFAAVQGLGFLGPAAAPALDVLARRLSAPEASLRSAACRALERLRDKAAPAAGTLALACFHEHEQTVRDALRALQAIGAAAAAAAPYVAELEEASTCLGPQARVVLAALGAGAPLPPPPDAEDLLALRAALRGPDGMVAGRAAFAIGRLAPSDADTIGALVEALSHASPYARRHAAFALERIGLAALPAIARVARERHGIAPRLAASTLYHFSMAAPPDVLPVALDLIDARDAAVRIEAIRACGMLGAPARDAVPALVPLLSADDPDLVQTVIWTLGRMGPDASAAAVPLANLLQECENHGLLFLIVNALGEVGLAAEPVVPVIVDAARWPRSSLYATAIDALVKIGPAGHAAVVQLIREESGLNRQQAMDILSRNNLRPPGLREALEEAIRDPDRNVGLSALYHLRTLDPEASPNVDSLLREVEILPDRDLQRSDLPRLLSQYASVKVLLGLARKTDFRSRWVAWRALATKAASELTDAERAEALPLLLEALDERDQILLQLAALDALHSVPLTSADRRVLRGVGGGESHSRASAQKAVAALGVTALPDLVDALRDEDRVVRHGAAIALAALGAEARPAVSELRAAAAAEPKAAAPFVRAIAATAELDAIATMYADRAMPERQLLSAQLVAAGTAALPQLDRLRRDPDPQVRTLVPFFLAKLGADARERLLEMVEDADAGVARAALAQLAPAGVPAEQAVPLLVRLFGRDDLRTEVLQALRKHHEPAVAALAELAERGDAATRLRAVSALGTFGTAAMPLLAARLDDPDGAVRIAAAAALGRFGANARPAVPRLVALLADPDRAARQAALRALLEIRPAAEQALPALMGLLRHDDSAAREAAATAVGFLGRDAKPALPALCALLTDAEGSVRVAAANALAKLGAEAEPALPDLLVLLRSPRRGDPDAAAAALAGIGAAALPAVCELAADDNPAVRANAVRALGRFGAAALEPIAARLADGNPEVRAAAVGALRTLGTDATPAVEALVALKGDPDGAVRKAACHAIANLGRSAEPAAAALVELLGDGDASVRADAAEAVPTMGPAAARAVGALRALLRDPDAPVRVAAARSLGSLRSLAEAAIPDLVTLLREGGEEDREAAAQALASLGPAASESLAKELEHRDPAVRVAALGAFSRSRRSPTPDLLVLVRLVADPDASVRAAAIRVFDRLGGAARPVLPQLLDLLDDENATTREAAATAIGALGRDGAPAVPALARRLRDPETRVRRCAARTLGRVGGAAEVALPDLLELLRTGNDAERTAAVGTLADLGAAAAPGLASFIGHRDDALAKVAEEGLARLGAAAVPAVSAAMGVEDEQVRRPAAGVMVRLGDTAVPALVGLMQDDRAAVRLDAAWALGTIGPRARRAVPALVAALSDEGEYVALQAAWALGEIGPAAADAIPALEKMRDDGRHRAVAEAALRKVRAVPGTDPR